MTRPEEMAAIVDELFPLEAFGPKIERCASCGWRLTDPRKGCPNPTHVGP